MTFFVERAVTAVLADGTSFDMHIRVGSPRQADQDWRCSLSVTYLFDMPRDIFGVDSWQALQLALQLAVQMLKDFVDRGGRLFHLGEPLEPAALLPVLRA